MVHRTRGVFSSMEFCFQTPDAILHDLLDGVPFPRMACLRYTQPTPPPIWDVGPRVREDLQRSGMLSGIRPGARIAIAAGSRGIAQLPAIVHAVVASVREAGGDPFIVPAMGSHGGATAEGQREVLAHLGVTEESAGAPIESCMETVEVGRTPDGTPVYADKPAAASDGIMLVRIKPHTAFRGEYESGLAKMIAIGLGKQVGAAATHARGFGEMARMVPAMARVALERLPILGGVATLENAHDLPFRIAAVPADRIMAEEPRLLADARTAMPRLPFDRLDVLVIDRIGKNISGDGADPNVTGRYPTPFASGGPEVTRQVVLDLDDASMGNANGIGTADFTTLRLARKMDLAATYPNSLTSTVPGPVKLPMVLPNDRMAFQAAILTCHAVNRPPLVVRIKDTLHLDEMWVSEALLAEVDGNAAVAVVDGPACIQFDERGDVTDLATAGGYR